MEPRLIDLVENWLREDPQFQGHFGIDKPEAGDATGEDGFWVVVCPCTWLTMASVFNRTATVRVGPPPSKHRLPSDQWIDMRDPTFFDALKYGILSYHRYVLDKDSL